MLTWLKYIIIKIKSSCSVALDIKRLFHNASLRLLLVKFIYNINDFIRKHRLLYVCRCIDACIKPYIYIRTFLTTSIPLIHVFFKCCIFIQYFISWVGRNNFQCNILYYDQVSTEIALFETPFPLNIFQQSSSLNRLL